MENTLDNTESPQHDAKLPVGSSTYTKELLECTVCWGSGKIEVDDYGNEEDCTWCNGTGLVSRNL
jgi:DnaJ-class molecular chaperone